ncbi:MAG: hypothetical protein AAFQ42_13890 [Pseudomonadota bacterium]
MNGNGDDTTGSAGRMFNGSSLRDALRAVAGLREPTTRPVAPEMPTTEPGSAAPMQANAAPMQPHAPYEAAPAHAHLEPAQPTGAHIQPAVPTSVADAPQALEAVPSETIPSAFLPDHQASNHQAHADAARSPIPSPETAAPQTAEPLIAEPPFAQPLAAPQTPPQRGLEEPDFNQSLPTPVTTEQAVQPQPAPHHALEHGLVARSAAPATAAYTARPTVSSGQTRLLRPEEALDIAPPPTPFTPASPAAPDEPAIMDLTPALRIDPVGDGTAQSQTDIAHPAADDTPSPASLAGEQVIGHNAATRAEGAAATGAADRAHHGTGGSDDMAGSAENDDQTRLVRGPQRPGRDDYFQEPVVAWLVVIGGPGLGAFRPVYEGNNAIGRAATQRIAIDFGDDAISAEEQAYIRYDSGDRSFLFVPNLAKTNVVSLNESKPTSAVPLTPMDVITVGQTQLVFVPFCGPEFDWSELKAIGGDA